MRFLDEYLPAKVLGVGFTSSPITNTTITRDAGGHERANQNWEHPRLRFSTPEATARDWVAVVQELIKFWRVVRGPFRTWPIRDPLDYASCDLVRPGLRDVQTVTMLDQLIGHGDGFTTDFQLTKLYSVGAETYTRTIDLPVTSSVLVAVDGVLSDPGTYEVSRPGGVVSFGIPPLAPDETHPRTITAGFLFDVNVRFESDDALEAVMRATRQAGFADLPLIEVPLC